jgi:hypothetical protein
LNITKIHRACWRSSAEDSKWDSKWDYKKEFNFEILWFFCCNQVIIHKNKRPKSIFSEQ